MRGAIRTLKRLAIMLVLLSQPLLVMILPQAAHAYPPLDFPKDIITNPTPAQNDVIHDISFVLPVDAQQITPTDFVAVTLVHFSSVTAPTDTTGAFGNPVFSSFSNILRVTNIVVLPGTGMHILGTTATNPGSGQGYDVIIDVREGGPSGPIRNESQIAAGTPSDGFVQMNATVESPLSAVTFAGYTSPGAFVVLLENNTVIGTTTGSGTGSFNIPISGLNPGDHTFRIFATDTASRSTSQDVLQLYLLGGTSTTVSGILLSSTIQVDKASLNPGDTLTIFGAAKPNSTINIYTESPLRTYTASSNNNGDWSYQLPGSETQNYTPGQYRTYTIVQDNSLTQSPVSPTVNFTINSVGGANPPPSCDISTGDLNCDGKTNLTDFSILLFYWHTNQRRADINSDGAVNLVDFSIMMYYFRRS